MDVKRTAQRGAAVGGAVLTTGVMVLGFAAPAHAADCKTTTEGYSHHKVTVCGYHFHQGVPTTTTTNLGGSLPRTGVDAGLLTIVGVGLVGGGTLLVASGRRKRRSSAAAA